MNEIIQRLREFDAHMKNSIFVDPGSRHLWEELNLLASMIQIDASYEISELELRQVYGATDATKLQDIKDHRKFAFAREVFQTIHSNPITHNLSEELTNRPDVTRVHFKMWIIPFNSKP